MTIPSPVSILLVQPLGYDADSADQDIARKANLMPPLGLASIAAYLEQYQLPSSIIDCNAFPASRQEIKKILESEHPSWIGFSCTTSTFMDGVDLAEFARSIDPAIRTVFGGVHVSALKKQLLDQFPIIDFLVIGEGEETLKQLLTCQDEFPENIEGIAYRNQTGESVFTGQRQDLLDLDSLPFPAYDKLPGYPEVYQLPIFNYPNAPNTSCISSRGCPYACSYCDRSVFQRSFRYNSADYLYKHLQHIKKHFGIRHINFYDDQFTFNRQRIEDLCNKLINEPLGITFNCAVRAEHVDLPLLQLMKKAGCWMISLGIETGDENLLSQHRQNANLEMLSEKILAIHKAGIRIKGLLMIGLPGESEASVKKSMDYVFSLPIDDINLAKFTPFPGSPLYQNIHQLGSFEEDWQKMDCMQFIFIAKGMTKERLDELFIAFYRAHFSRPKIIFGYVTMLCKSPDSWFRFLKNLGQYLSFARTNKRISSQQE